jgi:hypothetical protein
VRSDCEHAAVYVILTTKPGQFRTEVNDDLRPVAAYDYLFCGAKKAHFVIAELLSGSTKVRVVEEDGDTVNHVPSKFLPRFDTLERAVEELKRLTAFGRMDTALCRTDTC